MICVILSSALAAALWGWRLEAVKTDRLQCDIDIERINSAKWIELHGRKCDELAELSRKQADTELFLNSADEQNKKALDHINKLATKTEALENEIDGLNVDKLALKERLQKFEADQQKRREQKRAGMRRFRAKRKEAKG